MSFQTGYIPKQFKIAKVIPIYKSGDKHVFTNYRPISLLSNFSKLLEKIVARQVFQFLNKFKLLYILQYGFRKGHNTNHPILHVLKKIFNSLDSGNPKYTLSIFIDIKKAFDTVDHSILLKKLKFYGFHGITLTWFENYLGNGYQYVSIDGVDSPIREMTCGVPQGSVLGPLLFLIFINDLPSSTTLFTLLFAGDTTFQISSNNFTDLYRIANEEIEKASVWFKANKLTLNISKTKYMIFRTKI